MVIQMPILPIPEVDLMTEREREVIGDTVTLAQLQDRIGKGWRLAAIEWERDIASAEPVVDFPETGDERWEEEIPFGFVVSDDGRHLQKNPAEARILLAILEQIVQDRRFSQIAEELNRHGLRTRNGERWSSSAVFALLPQVIETGPRLVKSKEWQERRPYVVAKLHTA